MIRYKLTVSYKSIYDIINLWLSEYRKSTLTGMLFRVVSDFL